MILWHVGATIAIVRYVFKDPRMDLRFLAVGSLLPDLVDKPIGAVLFAGRFDSSRVYAHSLLFSAVLLLIVMLATERGSAQRRALLALPIGAFLHLFLDAQWAEPEGFWWPFLGFDFPAMDPHRLLPLLRERLTDPWVLAGEAAGLAYLAAMYRRAGLSNGERRRHFLRTGHLPYPLRPRQG